MIAWTLGEAVIGGAVAVGISAGLLLSALNGEIGSTSYLRRSKPRIDIGASDGAPIGRGGKEGRFSSTLQRCDDRRARHLITSHGHGRGIASFATHPFTLQRENAPRLAVFSRRQF